MSLDTRFKYICKTVLCYAELNHPADADCVCVRALPVRCTDYRVGARYVHTQPVRYTDCRAAFTRYTELKT